MNKNIFKKVAKKLVGQEKKEASGEKGIDLLGIAKKLSAKRKK